jgi:hypothetical protein
MGQPARVSNPGQNRLAPASSSQDASGPLK